MKVDSTPADDKTLQAFVTDYYGKLHASSADLKTNACCASGGPPAWIAARLANVSPEVSNRFYGCGFPIPHGLQSASVLDLGCGTGRDVYVSSQLVGANGKVHGVLAEVFRVLEPGGELYISDVFADRRLEAHVARDPVL